MRALTMMVLCGVVAAAGSPDPWAANGATACKRLLTPDFVSAIFTHADGESQPKPDGQSCLFSVESNGDFNSIAIGLSDHVTPASWDKLIAQNLPGGIPLAGVGDKAFRSRDATGLHAYKNDGRLCSVRLIPLGGPPKLEGDALAKKLGTLCTQLFAMQ